MKKTLNIMLERMFNMHFCLNVIICNSFLLNCDIPPFILDYPFSLLLIYFYFLLIYQLYFYLKKLIKNNTFKNILFNIRYNVENNIHLMTLKTLKYTNIKTQIQWNLSNPTHKGIREMCQIVQYVGILRFYFS